MTIVLFVVFILALLTGFPIAFALGLASFTYVVFSNIPLIIIPQKMYAGIDVFVLLCVPGFILAGNLMNSSGITERIIAFSNTIVGHIRGGLGLANVGASMLFAGRSLPCKRKAMKLIFPVPLPPLLQRWGLLFHPACR